MENREEIPVIPRLYTIGIIYNLKKGVKSVIEDIEAEYDNIETVHAIAKVLENNGHETILLEADDSLYTKLKSTKIDLVFNIAEGKNGRGREGQIPAMLSMLNIPYIGSDETTLCIALDKSLTKKLLSTYHIKSPRSILLHPNKSITTSGLKYPLIIKPNAEGSSKGISDVSIVTSHEKLVQLVKNNFSVYKEDMIAEEYIEGREFTVALLGNGDNLKVFRPMEIIFKHPTQDNYHVYSFNVKKDYENHIEYKCPADIDNTLEDKMMKTAEKIFKILECRDFARIDFRISNDMHIYFIEINPLPGLAPKYSDYPMITEFLGIDYDNIIMQIFNAGIERLRIQ